MPRAVTARREGRQGGSASEDRELAQIYPKANTLEDLCRIWGIYSESTQKGENLSYTVVLQDGLDQKAKFHFPT